MKEQLDNLWLSRCRAPMSLSPSHDKTSFASGPRSAETPLVSVIIPAYNAEQFIARTLESVLAQTYHNIEVLVIDDGSQDKTSQIIQDFMRKDSRIQTFQQKNSGVAAARNLGIQHSKGEFIAPIDADDIWHPENIAKQVRCFENVSSNVGLVYSWSLDIDEQDLPTGETHASRIEGSVYLTLLCHYFLSNASASLIRRSCLQKVGNYNSQFKENGAQGCEDWDLYLRIAEKFEFRFVPEFLVGYRKIPFSMTCDYNSMAKSHALMLQLAQARNPRSSEFLRRLSESSFFIYLARQCFQNADRKNTLILLRKALKANFFTSILRAELYTLYFKGSTKTNFESTFSTKSYYSFSTNNERELAKKDNAKDIFESTKTDIKSKFASELFLHKMLLFSAKISLNINASQKATNLFYSYRKKNRGNNGNCCS